MEAIVHDVLKTLYATWSSLPHFWILVVHFLITFMYGFGGGVIGALLLMDSNKVPLSFLHNGTLALTWTACWWIINYFPYRIPASIHSLWPVKMITKACVAYHKARIVASRVNITYELYPNTILGPVIIGAIAICGGKISHDTIRAAQGTLSTQHELFAPTYSWRCAICSSTLYFLLTKLPLTACLSPEEALTVIMTLLVTQSLLADLTGMPLDWTQPIVNTVLTLANIPVPGASKPAAARKAVPRPAPSQAAATPSQGSSLAAAIPRLERQGVTEVAVPLSGKGAQEPAKPQQTINAAASHRAQEYVAALQQEQQAKKKKAASADPGWTQVSYVKKVEPGKKTK